MLRNLETRNRRTPLLPPLGPDGPGRRNSALEYWSPLRAGGKTWLFHREQWSRRDADGSRDVAPHREETGEKCSDSSLLSPSMLVTMPPAGWNQAEARRCWEWGSRWQHSPAVEPQEKEAENRSGEGVGGWRITAYILAQVFIWSICPFWKTFLRLS